MNNKRRTRDGAIRFLSFFAAMVFSTLARAETATIATATNFLNAAQALQQDFEETTGQTLTIVSGSTGKLYAQILNGAPFDVFLAADQERPRLLIGADIASAGSQFTYAIGALLLWSPNPDIENLDNGEVLKSDAYRRLAIANPALAPYGLAAQEVLATYGLADATSGKIVMGENIGQTFSMVAKGGADLGFVAAAQTSAFQEGAAGAVWKPPQSSYTPIRQDAVLLRRGEENDAAVQFVSYLRSSRAADIISTHGYRTAP
ncbi:MAG: molybdate ABC transporter substrate-binding protein [Pseudomonadota bacterium]